MISHRFGFPRFKESPMSSRSACACGVALALLLSAGCHSDITLPEVGATLTVAGAGSGSGMVAATGAQPTLKCQITGGSADPSACQVVYAAGTALSLSATPTTGSHFSGWSGRCSGAASCSLALADSARVTATFDLTDFTLTVVGAGTGNGTVTSPSGVDPSINCGVVSGQGGSTGCAGSYHLSTTRLKLTAVARPGSQFSGWGGDCSGTSSCTITLDRDHVVSAAFVPRRLIGF
jgi:List-Bact-rpt repeat protein